MPVPLVPILLRLEDVKGQVKDVHMATLEQNAQGVVRMEELLLEGLLPGEDLQWPVEPLKSRIMRNMARMKLQTFAKQYKPVRETLLKDLLETLLAFELHRRGLHQEEEDNEQDGDTSMFSSSGVKEEAVDFTQTEQYKKWLEKRQKSEEEAAARAAKQAQADAELAFTSEQVLGWWDNLQYDGPEEEVVLANAMADKFYERWSPAMEALEKASRAFDFMEELLGGADGSFELQSNMWRRNAWKEMDKLRRTLENCRQLRDLVRSLGRSAGWGPLRRSPTQVPKDNAKDGLLRTVLEAQETRGLTRSDNISSMLPMEATLLAKGQKMRQAKLLFFQRVVERMLLSYERDGWAEIPAIAPDLNIREIRPTAERGPILLCLDTSGSMRGKRETVSKAIALECMRAAKVQERGCHVFCFSGPKVWELELGTDRESLVNLLDFLERIFNGGTEFSETLKRCLSRLETAEWANSDILLVTDGELRQPEPGLMRKLTGAKEAMGLRVHGLIIGSPETPKDPLVMKSLCTNYTRGAKDELLLHTFDNWGLLPDDFDFDDKVATALRVERSKRLEKARKEEEKRRRLDARAAAKKKG